MKNLTSVETEIGGGGDFPGYERPKDVLVSGALDL